MRFSPPLHDYLIQRVRAHDDGLLPIAHIWPRVRRDAWVVERTSPGYHAMPIAVRAERERRAARREALLVAVDAGLRRVPDTFRILDHLAAAAGLTRVPSLPWSAVQAPSAALFTHG